MRAGGITQQHDVVIRFGFGGGAAALGKFERNTTPTQADSGSRPSTRLAGRLALTLPGMSQDLFNGGCARLV